MRTPLEFWILVWILWTQVLVTVGVTYDVNHPIPVYGSSGQSGQRPSDTNMEDNSRTATVADPNIRRINDEDGLENVEGPIRRVVTPDRQEVHCVELRSRRYISDGFCTSIRPITEVVCAGSCIPNPDWFAEHTKVLGKTKRKEWRCVDDQVRQKKVTLLCENNETRTYRIKTVRSCKCKRISHQHNQSEWPNGNSSPRKSSNRNKRNRNNNRQ